MGGMDVPPPLPPPPPPPTFALPPAVLGRNRALLSAAFFVAVADYLLWPAPPRLSCGLLGMVLALGIVLNRPRFAWSPRAACICGLIAVTAVQSAIEISFSNLLVLGLL